MCPFRAKIDWKVDLRKEIFLFIENSVQKYYDNMEIRLLLQNLSFDSFRPFGPLKWLTIDRKIDLHKISSLLSKSASKNTSVTYKFDFYSKIEILTLLRPFLDPLNGPNRSKNDLSEFFPFHRNQRSKIL